MLYAAACSDRPDSRVRGSPCSTVPTGHNAAAHVEAGRELKARNWATTTLRGSVRVRIDAARRLNNPRAIILLAHRQGGRSAPHVPSIGTCKHY